MNRFRFSLRTLLVAITLVAIVIALVLAYRQSHENELLRQENIRLRSELGEILVEPGDESKLHAIALITAESMSWKWRLVVPAGRKISLYAAADRIPAANEPPIGYSSIGLSPGDQTLTLTLRKNYHDQWCWSLKTQQGNCQFSVSPELAEWFDSDKFGIISTGVTSLTKTDLSEDLSLLRLRLTPNKNKIDAADLNTAGPGVSLQISEH